MGSDAHTCTSMGSGRVCGRPLVLRHFTRKDGRLCAAAVCRSCDALERWQNHRQAKAER